MVEATADRTQLPIMGVGGIMTPADAQAFCRRWRVAGAALHRVHLQRSGAGAWYQHPHSADEGYAGDSSSASNTVSGRPTRNLYVGIDPHESGSGVGPRLRSSRSGTCQPPGWLRRSVIRWRSSAQSASSSASRSAASRYWPECWTTSLRRTPVDTRCQTGDIGSAHDRLRMLTSPAPQT